MRLIALLVLLLSTDNVVAQEVSIEVIHSFSKDEAGGSGIHPGHLTPGPDGLLYGTTTDGGPGGGGTVFRMGLNGAITTLHVFQGRDGLHPDGCLLPGADGAFYGTTGHAGFEANRRSVFRITPRGEFNTVYVDPWSDSDSVGVVIKGADGQAYAVHLGRGSVTSGSFDWKAQTLDEGWVLIGDKRFAASLPNVRLIRMDTSKGWLTVESLFKEGSIEPTSTGNAPPARFDGTPKQPLCGVWITDLYGRVWGGGAQVRPGVGTMAFYQGDWKGPEIGLIAGFRDQDGAWQSNPDYKKFLTFRGQHVPAPDGGVYAIAGGEIVHLTREGRAPTLLSLAPLLAKPYDEREVQFDGLLLAADGYIYGQLVPRRTGLGIRKLFRFRLDGPLEVLKPPSDDTPMPHLTDLLELSDGSFIGPADGGAIVQMTIRDY